MLHQVTIATDYVQRVHNRLPGLICEEDEQQGEDKLFAINAIIAIVEECKDNLSPQSTFLSFYVGISDEPGAR